ncbi:hypothetical protein FNF27_06796 [Cafeteria roenbergensis]|uniref:RCC1-like domain-containing protein n=1 Tax=Cafeteria roenbergensis TaxID=33653 RepID=A0A5A8DYY8_CAFRO|nr:hypothetical protein FNF31_05944 [Cafeteria roenbergensis]KAA0169904.1 hypothetical protein FNF27_06796 [Cafeteria roenbergensis]
MDLGAVPLGGLAKAVAAGTYHSVVLLVDGSVRTFGYGANGMLGYGSTTNVGNKATTLPSAQGGVGLGGEAVAVAAGTSHTVVAMADGKVFAFGKGGGQLGYGSTDDIGDTTDTLPLTVGPVSLGGNAVAVAAGTYHSLVLLDNGSVLAFGYGTYGRLGYGDTLTVGDTSQTLPSMQGPVSLGGNAVAVAAGEEHSVVLLEDGTIRAFGNGGSGRLGYGDTSNVGDTSGTVPSEQGPVSLGGKAVAVAAGEEHSLVILEDGTIRAFGNSGSGRLGYGDTSNVGDTSGTVPSEQGPVSLGGNAVAVAAGDYHCVVMLEDGTARAFGQGASGRLGYGETTDVGDTPETVPSEKGPVPLADADGLVVSHSLANADGLVVSHSLADADGLVVGLCLRDVHRQPLRFANRLRRRDRQHRQQR